MKPIHTRQIQTNRARAKAGLKVFYARFRALICSLLFLGLAIATSSILFFAWLAEEVMEGDTRFFDETVRSFIHGFANDGLTTLMKFITLLGSTLFLSLLSICILLIFINKKMKRHAVLLLTTMAGAVILNFALKVSFERARPVPFFETPLPESYSFPSGHSLYAVCFYVCLAWLITPGLSNYSARVSIWILAVFICLLIGLSRIYLGVHYPSDVIAGFTAAIVWLSALISIDFIIKKRSESLKIKEF
ncbi:MAG TPA: phosphatase PAP2 family protein [Pyrinomonadaceae bacterium]